VPYLAHDPMPLEGFALVYADLLARGSFHVWEVSGALAGFYRTQRYDGRARHVALLGTVAIDPQRHGQGVGRAMVADAIERLRADGVRRVELFAESDNPRALRFYAGLGFVLEGTLRQFYKRDGEAGYVDEHVLGLLLA